MAATSLAAASTLTSCQAISAQPTKGSDAKIQPLGDLPAWIGNVRSTVPGWIDQVKHPSGPGRYRFAVDAYEPYDIDSSVMCENVIYTINYDLPSSEQKKQWSDYLLSLQRPEDGCLIDTGMEKHIITDHDQPTPQELAKVRFWTTRNGLGTAVRLGGKPRYPVRHEFAFTTPAEMIGFLEKLPWNNPWHAGSWAGGAVVFQHFNRLLGDQRAQTNIEAAVRWLKDKQDPNTGAWHDGSNVPLHELVNGIFKIWIQVCRISDLPVQYPERVIDLCIRARQESPALAKNPDMCSIFDWALVLDIALRYSAHRKAEVANMAYPCLNLIQPMVRPDGGFSYHPDRSLENHGGLALAPSKNQSDAPGTAMACQTLALLSNLCGLRETLGWAPITEWQMGISAPQQS